MQSTIIRQLGIQSYRPIWQKMQDFTDRRTPESADEIWLVEHTPVFTQGQAGKAEHLLATGDIQVVQVDRGGQVTYHGPGQQMLYILIDVRRSKRITELKPTPKKMRRVFMSTNKSYVRLV
jgi:lipoyl(octanoyl) transferase